MTIPELEALVTLAEVGSITKAADELHVSPPAVHKRLKSLEESLDVQLYDKVGQHLKLTTVANGLLPHVRGLLSQRNAIFSYVEEWKGLEQGVIRIGAGSTFSCYLLPPLLEAYQNQFPDVEVLVDTGKTPSMLEDLTNGDLDLVFAVSSELLSRQRYVVEARWEFDVVLVADPRQLPCDPQNLNLDEAQFVLFQQERGVFPDLVNQHFARIGLDPNIAMVFDNLETVKAMTMAGLGVSVLPRWTIERDLEDDRLVTISKRGFPIALEEALVTHQASHLTQPVTSFIALTRDWSWVNARLTP